MDQVSDRLRHIDRIKTSVYNYYDYTAPRIVRVLIFKNFQRKDQSLEIKNIVIDDQYGVVEIAETKW